MNKSIIAAVAMAAVFAVGSAGADPYDCPCMQGVGGRGDGTRLLHRMDTNKDGLVTREEVRIKGEELFKQADTDGDGILSLAELTAMKEVKREARLKTHLERMDNDKDGKVTKDEFVNRHHLFDRWDANNTGVIALGNVGPRHGRGYCCMNPGQPGWGGQGPMGWGGPGWGYGPGYR